MSVASPRPRSVRRRNPAGEPWFTPEVGFPLVPLDHNPGNYPPNFRHELWCTCHRIERRSLAKGAGARIALLTAHPENEHGQLADLCVRIPGQIFGGSQEVKSIQPMASLLEQALFLFTDIVVMLPEGR